MDTALHERIDGIVKGSDVVLFMKGNRRFPRCGFSATAIEALDELGVEFETIDVLSDPDIRSGIKEYSDWPTIPQLYVKSEFVGGSDIIRQMAGSGDLHKMLGLELEEVATPEVTLTDGAVEAFRGAAASQEGELRLKISRTFQYSLQFTPRMDGDFEITSNGFTLLLDRGSAARANGMTVDFKSGPTGGVVIENPNEPASVKKITATELATLREDGVELTLLDVRSAEEIAIARIDGALPMDDEAQKLLETLPKDTKLVFHCHHGGRSQQAAEFYLAKGFTDVSNVTGGIDAWAKDVDPTLTRY